MPVSGEVHDLQWQIITTQVNRGKHIQELKVKLKERLHDITQ